MQDKTIETPKPSKRRFNICGILWLLLIGTMGYLGYQDITQHQDIQRLHNKLQKIENDQNQIQSTLNTTQQTLQSKFNQLEEHLVQTTATPATEINHQWLIYKAGYAIELAQFNAHWSQDNTTTLLLLKQADDYLAEIHDPKVFPLRQALAKDILAQQTISKLDITGVFSQLNAVQQQIANYHFEPLPATEEVTKPAEHPPTGWYYRLYANLKPLKQFFVIHHDDELLQTFLSPAYQELQKEIILLNLHEAEWALLKHNQSIYDISLKQAIDHINRTLSKHHPAISQLKALQTLQINNPQVIPADSFNALQRLMPTNIQSSGVPS